MSKLRKDINYLTGYISSPAPEDHFNRTFIDQSEVKVSLLVHANRAKIQDRLARRRREKLEYNSHDYQRKETEISVGLIYVLAKFLGFGLRSPHRANESRLM